MALNLTATTYDYRATDAPDDPQLVTYVPKSRYVYKQRPKENSAYREFSWREERLIGDHGDWLFIRHDDNAPQSQHTGESQLAFYWKRNWTAQEIAAPVPFRSTWDNEMGVYWPQVLEPLPSGKIIEFLSDGNFPFNKTLADGTTGTMDRILVDYALRKEWDGPTRVRTDLYLSPQPWSDEALAVNHPQPTHVYWNQTPTTEDLGWCLHDDIVIPAFGAVTATGGAQPVYYDPVSNGKILPATNYSTWVDRYISKDQQYVNGQWLITCKWAKAPPRGEIVGRYQA